MNSTCRVVVVGVVLVALMANPVLLAWGNPPPGRWEKVAQTEPGQKLLIFTKNGGKNTYIFRSLDNQFLHCVHPTIGDMQIELDTVQEIVFPKAGEYAKRGILWGAVVGAGVGIGLLVPWTDATLMVPVGFAAIGAGAGYVTGAALGAPGETIYISKVAALAK